MNDRRFQLTEFDREVLSVLLSHGGWNAAARAQLAALAKRYGVSPAGLSRVVNGLAQAARTGQLQAAAARSLPRSAPGRAADGPSGAARSPRAGAMRSDGARGGVGVGIAARSPGDASIDARLSRSDRVLLGIVAASFVISILLIVQLGVIIHRGLGNRTSSVEEAPASELAGEPSARGADAATRESTPPSTADADAPAPSSTASEDVSSTSNLSPTSPATPASTTGTSTSSAASGAAARPPPVPAIYPRVPGFRALLDSPAFLQAEAEASAAQRRLEDVARDPRSMLAAPHDWANVQRAIGWSWPRLDPAQRRALLERTVAIARVVDDAAVAEALLEPFRAGAAGAPIGPAEIRHGAWSAGVIGALLTEPGLSPEVVQAITAARLAPADGAGDAFERFAAGWLDPSIDGVMERVGDGTAQEDFDRLEAWIEAQERVRSPAEANEAWLRAVDAMLRRPLRVDLPGSSADMLGRLLAQVDWRQGAPVTSAALRRRFEQWLADPAIESPRLWALGSIVRQGAMAPWFAPDMVVAERATMNDRRGVAQRILAVLSAGPDDAAAVASAPKELVQRHEKLVERILGGQAGAEVVAGARGSPAALALSGASAPARRAVDEALEVERLAALGVVGAMLLDGRTNEASERLAALERGLDAPALAGLGPGGRSLPLPPEPSSDGTLGQRLDQAKSGEERIDAIRRRRTEASTDLGPLDAARLAREALLGESIAVRLTAQGVIVDSFASGPRVAQQLIDHFWLVGSWDSSLSRFVERLTGERLPPHTNPRFRAEALAALLRHRLKLSEHAWHAVEALLARAAALSAERVDAEGGAAEGLRDVREPGAAIDAMAGLLRARAGSRAVLEPVPAPLEELDRRDEARRALASGPAHRWIASLWRAFELEAFVTAADRPGSSTAVKQIIEECVASASKASTALGQAVEIERARVRLQSLRLAAGAGGAT